MTDFEKYAISNKVNSTGLDKYKKHINRIVCPTIIEEREMNAVPMDVFSCLMNNHIIFLGDELDSDVSNIVAAQLMYLNSIVNDDESVKMFINTPGGIVTGGLMIYDIMNFVDADVETYNVGMSASMGAVLLSSGTKGKRYSTPHGSIMIHQIMTGTGLVQAKDMEIAFKNTSRMENMLYSILAYNTGRSYENIKDACDRDNWMSASDVKDFGLIDEIVE